MSVNLITFRKTKRLGAKCLFTFFLIFLFVEVTKSQRTVVAPIVHRILTFGEFGFV